MNKKGIFYAAGALLSVGCAADLLETAPFRILLFKPWRTGCAGLLSCWRWLWRCAGKGRG